MSSTQAMPAVATAAFQPSPVSAITRSQWCKSQEQACPDICNGSASTNLCSTNDLSWVCLCSNGTVPDVTAFIDTLPYYICQETFSQCMANNIDNAQGRHQCANNEQCGTRNATAEYIASQNPAAVSSVATAAITTSSSTTSYHTSSPTIQTSTVMLSSSSSSTTPSSIASAVSNSSPSGMSPGTLTGVAVGSAVAGILLTIVLVLLYRRCKRVQRDCRNAELPTVLGPSATNPASGPPVIQDGRLDSLGDSQKYGSRCERGISTKSEMPTNSNRHELDDTEISGTLRAPWSHEMEGRHELGDSDGFK